MVNVEIQEANGVALRTENGQWTAVPVNTVMWKVEVDHIPTQKEAKEVLAALWETSTAKKLTAFIPAVAVEIVRVVKSVGFKQEGRLKDACELGDLIIVGRLR